MSNGVPTAVKPEPATEQGTISNINNQLQVWKDKGAHVLAPLTLQTLPPMHRPIVVAVQIDPDTKNKEVYPQRGGGLSISSLGWKKIGDAIGIQWQPTECGRTDDGKDPDRVVYRMVGLVKALDGTWRKIIGDKEIYMPAIIEELTQNYRDKAEAYLNDPKDGPAFRKNFPTPEAIQGWITEKVRADAIQMRKHMLARAQSGAMARATKNLGIRETYTADELKKPFVFPKLVFTPDPTNPQDRQFLLMQGSGATNLLYPVHPATAPQPALIAVPPAEMPQEVAFIVPPDEDVTPATEAPAKEDQTRADFAGCDVEGQVQVLKELVTRKGYTKTVRGEMKAWKPEERRGFLDMLLTLPDVATKKPEPEPGKLPWE